ncbi:sensor histidine kinase [Vibrio lamellibrachiae]|uniref:sensor histidine kinase n=1 Tax=Vibrio lamellibrachiae TaxID=2910253 RepID=UPI003D0B5DB9
MKVMVRVSNLVRLMMLMVSCSVGGVLASGPSVAPATANEVDSQEELKVSANVYPEAVVRHDLNANTVDGETVITRRKTVVNVGVLAIRGRLYAEHRWQPTMDWLTHQVPNTHFELMPLTLKEMAEAVKTRQVDFIITNPGQAVQLGRQYELSWLATMTTKNAVNRTNSIGSALVVRRLSPYISLEQLQGKSIAAVSENAFGGYLSMRYEVMNAGLNPQRYFSNTQFLGFPIDVSLYQLRDGNVDAAIVPVCLLENMISEGLLAGDKFRVIDSSGPDGFGCFVSTPLYPNWSFANTGRVSSLVSKQVAQALFSMPSSSDAALAAKATGWTSPVSLLAIDKLYQGLDIHPLQQPWWKEALTWLRYNQQWAWAFFVLVVVLNVYHFWLEFKFSRSKKQLEQTQNRLKEKSELLEHSQRVAVVGELGSSLAHEINQPLAAIRNYSEGGLLRLAKQKPAEEIAPIFEKIQNQVDRADGIIQRLRSMIKKRSSEKQETDLERLISETIELLDFRLSKQNITIQRNREGELYQIWIDPIGIQQAIVNLINNSADACMSHQYSTAPLEFQPTIEIRTQYSASGVIIEIIDNGVGLPQHHDQLEKAFMSTKDDGLGLGLAICRDVIDAHNGQLDLTSILPTGCKALITLPALRTDKDVT